MHKFYSIYIIFFALIPSCLFSQEGQKIHFKNGDFLLPEKIDYPLAKEGSGQNAITALVLDDLTTLDLLAAELHCEISMLDQIGNKSFVVSVSSSDLNKILNSDHVVNVFDIPRRYKMASEITDLKPSSKIKIKLSLYGILNENDLRTMLPNFKISEVRSFGNKTYVLIDTDQAGCFALSDLPVVQSIQLNPENYTFLNFYKRGIEAFQGANAAVEFGGLGLNGEGIVIGHGDSGAFDHEDLNDRVTDFTRFDEAFHASHTGGTLIGAGNVQEKQRGFLNKATLINVDAFDIVTNGEQFYRDYNVRVTNNSYATIEKTIDCSKFGEYDLFAQEVDESIVHHPDLIHVWASGNSGALVCEGVPLAFNSVLSGPQCSKNGITVGSIWRREGTPVAEFSCQGPTDDGRIKPEIVTQGTNTTSAGNINNYYTTNGTSMSAPSITAAIAAMQEAYKKTHSDQFPSSDLLKAILTNTADDLLNEGPEFSNGYGKLNAAKAAKEALDGTHTYDVITQGVVKEMPFSIGVDVAKAVVTLCWIDPSGNSLVVDQLINDLDLELIGPDGTILPWTLDPDPSNAANPAVRGVDSLNNLEQISIIEPKAGNYTIRVRGNKVQSQQAYALAYRTEGKKIIINAPFGGEKYIPGEFEYFQWECPHNNGKAFDISISYNDGQTWELLGSRADSLRTINFNMTQVRTGQARLMVSKEGFEPDTSGRFTICPIPTNFSITPLCRSYAALKWSPVVDAVGYKIYKKTGFYMVEIAQTADTTYILDKLDPEHKELISVAAVLADGGIGRRCLSLFTDATGDQCPWVSDLTVKQINMAETGRVSTSTEFKNNETISITVHNLGSQDAAGFRLFYNVGNGDIIENFNGIILAGSSQIYNFSTPANFSNPGEYSITAGIVDDVDAPFTQNNITTKTIRQLPNDGVIVTNDLNTTFRIDFENATNAAYTGTSFGLKGIERFDFITEDAFGRARTFVLQDINRSGNRSMTIDRKNDGPLIIDQLVATLNMSEYSVTENIKLDFSYLNHNADTLPRPQSKVWARGSDQDEWVEIYDLYINEARGGSYKNVLGLELTKAIYGAGQHYSSSTQIRFDVEVSGPAIAINSYGGYTFDDIILHIANNDIAIGPVRHPGLNDCGLSASEAIVIEINNTDVQQVDNINAWYQLNNDAVQGPFSVGSIVGGQKIEFAFPPADLSLPGKYELKTWVTADVDNYRVNDTLETYRFTNNKYINTFPYFESFESDNGDWYTDGSRSSWAWGIPQKTNIKEAANSQKIWTTNPTGNYQPFERSYLVSPCFDLSAFTIDPMLSFSIAYELEPKFDGAFVEYSEDGFKWEILGAHDEGSNWYNKEGRWDSLYNYWHVASIPIHLDKLSDKSSVQFRFSLKSDESVTGEGLSIDDVTIYAPSPIYNGDDISVSETLSNEWTDFKINNDIIGALKYNGDNPPGLTELSVYFNPDTDQRKDELQYYLDRNFKINTELPLTNGSIDVRLFMTDEECERSRTAPDGFDKPTTAYELGVTKIKSEVEDGVFGNEVNPVYNFFNFENSLLVPYNNGYYIEFTINDLSEFYINTGGSENKLPLGNESISTNDAASDELEVVLFPNPMSEEYYLKISGLEPGMPISSDLYNIIGQKVDHHEWTSGQNRIRSFRNDLTKGVYFIHLNIGGSHKILKLNKL